MILEIKEESVKSSDAVKMMEELSYVLKSITGSSGKASFKEEEMNNCRSIFVIAYCDKQACGCGALKYYNDETAEIKRLYAKNKGRGIGKNILHALESRAKELNYHSIILETRKINKNAVSFYQNNGYKIIDNYGKYVGRDKAVCFYKHIY